MRCPWIAQGLILCPDVHAWLSRHMDILDRIGWWESQCVNGCPWMIQGHPLMGLLDWTGWWESQCANGCPWMIHGHPFMGLTDGGTVSVSMDVRG